MVSKIIVENCFALSSQTIANGYLKKYPKDFNPTLVWNNGFRVKLQIEPESIILDYYVNGTNVSCRIKTYLSLQPNGGFRRSFICPVKGCNNKSRVLYLPPGGQLFGCRMCHTLTYRSCRESHKSDYLFNLIASRLNLKPSEVRSILKTASN